MDWTGNAKLVYKTLGASNHTEDERQTDDYYATAPENVQKISAQNHICVFFSHKLRKERRVFR